MQHLRKEFLESGAGVWANFNTVQLIVLSRHFPQRPLGTNVRAGDHPDRTRRMQARMGSNLIA
jgi:hypothetical protein